MNHTSLFLSYVLLCVLCAAVTSGQNARVDSLLHRLDAAKSDSARVSLLVSLSVAYRQVDQRKALDAACTQGSKLRGYGVVARRKIGELHQSVAKLLPQVQ